MKYITAITVLATFAFVYADDSRDPFRNFNFQIQLDGKHTLGGFSDISGLGVEIELAEYQDGSDMILRKRPGRTKYSNIVLKRGLFDGTPGDDSLLEEWFGQVRRGEQGTETHYFTITLQEATVSGIRSRQMKLNGVFPIAWNVVPSVDASGNHVFVEEVSFAVEHIETLFQ